MSSKYAIDFNKTQELQPEALARPHSYYFQCLSSNFLTLEDHQLVREKFRLRSRTSSTQSDMMALTIDLDWIAENAQLVLVHFYSESLVLSPSKLTASANNYS